MQMKRQDFHAIAQALGALDSRPQVIKDKEGHESVVHLQYAFNGKVLMQIARARRALRDDVEQYNDTRNSLIKQLSNGAQEVKRGTTEFSKLNDEMERLNKEVLDIDVPKISEADLRLDINAIPPSVVEALIPLLE